MNSSASSEPVVLTEAQIIHDFGMEIARLRESNAALLAVVTEELPRVVAHRDGLLALIHEHYPTIAGHVLRLQEGHEDRAAAEWLAVAREFAAVLK